MHLQSDRVWSGMAATLVLTTALLGGLGCPGVATEPAVAAKEAAPDILPESAREKIGQRVRVTFRVRHAKFATMPDRVYLDSEKDYRDPKNLGVLIEADSLPAFTKAGITKPAEHYDGKTIRLTGTVFVRDDNVFIAAERPEQIEIIPDDKTAKPPAPSGKAP